MLKSQDVGNVTGHKKNDTWVSFFLFRMIF